MLTSLIRLRERALRLLASVFEHALDARLRLGQLLARLLGVLDALANHLLARGQCLGQHRECELRQHNEHDGEDNRLRDQAVEVDPQWQTCLRHDGRAQRIDLRSPAPPSDFHSREPQTRSRLS